MAFNWKEVKELYPLAYDHLREGWSWSANPSGVETGLQIKHYLKKEHSLKSQGISQVLKQFEQKLSTEKGMEDESFKLTHKQDLALKRFERALRALDDAEIVICGMDNSILWATRQACDDVEPHCDWGEGVYPEPAEVVNSCDDKYLFVHGGFYGSPYDGSGGF